jgi:hypothetical protein
VSSRHQLLQHIESIQTYHEKHIQNNENDFADIHLLRG